MTQESENRPETITFSRRKTIIYSLLPALLLFGGVEGCARLLEVWRPPLTLDHGWGFNEDSRVFVPAGIARNTLMTRPEKLASFAPQSFSMPKPENVYRIFALGGSNVNYMYWSLQHLGERLTETPGETRRFEIINLGGLAYGSHRLRIVASEILGYDPDLVLIYAGHNEFEEIKHQELVDTDRMSAQKAAYSLAMLRTLRDLWATIDMVRRTRQAEKMELKPEVDFIAAAGHVFTPEEIAERMALYQENLEAIATACNERNVPVIISTVATNLWAPDLPRRFADEKEQIATRYTSGNYEAGMDIARDVLARSERHQASDVENSIIREVAAKHKMSLIEGEALIMEAEPHGVPGETLLSDRCHLTGEGHEIILAAFEKTIRQLAHVGQP